MPLFATGRGTEIPSEAEARMNAKSAVSIRFIREPPIMTADKRGKRWRFLKVQLFFL
jgi:hypothetical protein